MRVELRETPFEPLVELERHQRMSTGLVGRCGATAIFIGTMRDFNDGDTVQRMTLEHYPGMTERAIAGIAAQAEARWPLTGCTVIHRVGRILPGEPIVLVLTASQHRTAALEACEFLIDWLKTGAPFWKREEWADGRERWVEARAADDDAAARWSRPQA